MRSHIGAPLVRFVARVGREECPRACDGEEEVGGPIDTLLGVYSHHCGDVRSGV